MPKLADNPWKEEDIQRNEAGKLRPGPSGQTRAWPQLCTGQQQQPPGQTLRQNPAAVMKSQEPEPVKIVAAAARTKPRQAAPQPSLKLKQPPDKLYIQL